jgi:uncharacterized membrane protein HdeD (DUF308 family)
MSFLRSFFFRAICSMVIGILLIVYPDAAMKYLVMAIGALFIIPGIVSIILFFTNKPEEGKKPTFPLVGIGSTLLGVLLLVMPDFFISWLMYLLGAALIIAGAFQIAGLFKMRHYTKVASGLYILPVLVTISGIFILLKPLESASIPFIILGVSSIVYGLDELINALRFRSVKITDDEEPAKAEEINND